MDWSRICGKFTRDLDLIILRALECKYNRACVASANRLAWPTKCQACKRNQCSGARKSLTISKISLIYRRRGHWPGIRGGYNDGCKPVPGSSLTPSVGGVFPRFPANDRQLTRPCLHNPLSNT